MGAARYEIRRVITRGSPEVFEGRDRKTGRAVTLYRLGHEARERNAALVCHPNVVTVLDVAETANGAVLVTERLVGETLAERIARGGVLTRTETVAIFTQVLSALDAVHAVGLVHCDISPETIFLAGAAPLVKLVGFGQSIVTHAQAHPPERSTSPYASPEIRRDGPVDARADLFSVAAAMYEALLGRPPFESSGDMSALPSSFARVVARALSADPDSRFPSAREMLHALTSAESWNTPTREIELRAPRQSGILMRPATPTEETEIDTPLVRSA